jgi:DNA repair protein RadC
MNNFSLPDIKARVMAGELASLSDAELLAALLAYAKQPDPSRDATRLLHTAGSLSSLLRLDMRELIGAGLTPHAATLLTLVLPLWGRTFAEELPANLPLLTATLTGEYLTKKFFGAKAESACLLLLRQDFTVIDCHRVADGSVNTATLNSRVVAETAVFSGASYAILAHNHPAGSVMPSRSDLATTERLRATFDTIGIPLLEHFIIAEGEHLPILWATYAPHPALPDGYYDREYPHITLETL